MGIGPAGRYSGHDAFNVQIELDSYRGCIYTSVGGVP